MSRFRLLIVVALYLFQGVHVARAQEKPIAIVAGTIIDGAGKVLHNQAIVVQGSKIMSIGGQIPAGASVYNLGTLTVTPGLIDTHAHIMWHFDNGRLAGKDEQPLQAMLHAVDNAVVTLNAGFTTIQSPGAPEDKYLRDAIARGIIPGPRILTSLQPLTEASGDPEKLRELGEGAETGGGRLHQDLCLEEHSRRRSPNDERCPTSGRLRRGEEAGTAHASSRPRSFGS